jgi:ABC-type antimicrobial peptide transport system permease subunit
MIGGMLVALAGLVAITIVNFNESKRLFGLLRLRGASPGQLMRVVLADLVAPLSVGACIGVPVGLVTGYGLTNAIFALPRAASILQILPVHLTLGWLVAAIIGGVFVFFLLSSYGLSSWVFRKTAREALG